MTSIRSVVLLAVFGLLCCAGSARAQDQLTKQAISRIDKVEKRLQELKPGDAAAAKRCLTDLNWAAKRLGAVYDKSEEHYLATVERHKSLRAKVEALAGQAAPPKSATGFDLDKLRQLNKEIGNAYRNLKMLNVTHMGDAFRVKSIQREIENFTDRLDAFPAAESQVKIVAGNLASFRTLFKAGYDKYQADLAKAGDHLARMAELEKKYASDNVPASLEPPYEIDQLRTWGARLVKLRADLPMDLAFVDGLKGAGGIDKQKQSSLRNWIGSTWPRKLDGAQRHVGERVRGAVVEGLRNTEFVLTTDPKDRNHVANRILGEGAFDGHMQRLQQALHAIDCAAALDLALGLDKVEGAPDRAAQRKQVEAAIGHLRLVAEQALDQVRMPAAKSTDAALLKIARETLANEKYGVGEVVRMVINAPMRHHEMKSGSIQRGTVTSTLNVYTYIWDQFQVCTAEKEGDDVWLYFNTLKRYTSGDSTTPLETWILSKRFKSTRILAENVAKEK